MNDKKVKALLICLLLCLMACTAPAEKVSAEPAPKEQEQGAPANSISKEVLEIASVSLREEQKETLLAAAEKAISDYYAKKQAPEVWLPEFDNMDRRVYSILRKNGKRLGSWYTRENNLEQTVYQATIKNLKRHKIAEADAKDLDIHVQVFGDYEKYDAEKYQKGLHGLRVERGEAGANYYGSYALEGNYKATKMLPKLCKKAGLEENCWQQEGTDLFMYKFLHFAKKNQQGEMRNYYRGGQADFEVDFSLENTAQSLKMAENWLTSNVQESGAFTYVYNPSSGDYSTNNNMIRQLMGSRQLAEMASKDPTLEALHKKNLEQIFREWYQEENGQGMIVYKDKSKLGAIAMALRTLVYSPFYEQYENEAQALFESILFMQKETGAFSAWKIAPNYKYDEDYLLTFYSGEAILSVLEYYQKSGDKRALEVGTKAQDFYVKEYVDKLSENYYPAYVPWHTQSLHLLYKISQDEKYARAALTLNDELLKIQNTSGLPCPDFLGRFYHPDFPQYGSPHSASDGVYVEGIAYAYELADWLGDEARKNTYKKAIEIGVHNLLYLQYKDSNSYYMAHPDRVKGAIRFRADDNRIRIDTTQHMMDAFRKILEIFA